MWVSMLLNYSMLGAFLFYMLILWKCHPFSIGGSLIFISLIGINSYLSFKYKQFARELTFVSIIVFSLMVLNFLAYIENVSDSLNIVLFGTIAIIFIMSHIIALLADGRFGPKETSTSVITIIELRKRIMGLIFHIGFISSTFSIVTASVFLAIRDEMSTSIDKHILKFSAISLICFIAGLIFVLLMIRKWKNIAYYIPYIVLNKSDVNIDFLRKWFFHIAMGLLIIGLAFESQRGFWLLWIFSWLAFILIIVLEWKIWKYVFSKDVFDIATLELEKIQSMPSFSFSDPQYALKLVGTSTLAVVIYGFALIALAWYWHT